MCTFLNAVSRSKQALRYLSQTFGCAYWSAIRYGIRCKAPRGRGWDLPRARTEPGAALGAAGAAINSACCPINRYPSMHRHPAARGRGYGPVCGG
jgi:hypothetical protein